SLLLCIITSKVERRTKYYEFRHKTAVDCLVKVDNNILSFLKVESVIDCNSIELIPKKELLDRIDPTHSIVVKQRNISNELKEEIGRAIKKSPLVKPYIKKLLKC
ncbi:hypothetical protein MBAV_000119, partial [Candidatus Magnetobacterium bavaricum]